MRASGRHGGFDVAAASPPDTPMAKYRTIIAIQPDDDPPSRRSSLSPRPSNGHLPGDGADPSGTDADETASVTSSASSWTADHRRQNGHHVPVRDAERNLFTPA